MMLYDSSVVSVNNETNLKVKIFSPELYSAKKVLHNWGLWQFISNTGNTRLRDLYQHIVPSLRNILFEMESKSHEKCLRNKCLMVPGVGNQK